MYSALTWSLCVWAQSDVAVVAPPGDRLPPPPLYIQTSAACLGGGGVCVSLFSLPSAPFFLLLPPLLLLLFLGCLDLLLSVFMGPGTIRKAQNLLKQYSQHGLDGKKGGSNLTPSEGNAPRSPLRCLLSPPLTSSLTVLMLLSHPEQHEPPHNRHNSFEITQVVE